MKLAAAVQPVTSICHRVLSGAAVAAGRSSAAVTPVESIGTAGKSSSPQVLLRLRQLLWLLRLLRLLRMLLWLLLWMLLLLLLSKSQMTVMGSSSGLRICLAG
jgi:hypothetical protein